MLDADPITGTYRSVQNPDIVIGADLWALQTDQLTLRSVQEFAQDSNRDAFLAAFKSGWEYLMTADRFDGPRSNACDADGAILPRTPGPVVDPGEDTDEDPAEAPMGDAPPPPTGGNRGGNRGGKRGGKRGGGLKSKV